MNNTMIFQTVIGSHMWQMNHANSDTDLFQCYVLDSDMMLIGIRPKNTQTKIDGNDVVTAEIGKVIEQLKKGNVNYIWNVTSPLTNSQHKCWLLDLRKIVWGNLSKLTYKSIHDLAVHNIKHFLERKKYDVDYKKKLNIIGRTVKFGIFLLRGKGLLYQKVKLSHIDEAHAFLNILDEALENSPLPEKPDPEPFNRYLIKLRKEKIKWDK